LSALISFMPEKWVGLNILGKLALIFLALVTGPLFFWNEKIKLSKTNMLSKL
jgi:hypothetical protein